MSTLHDAPPLVEVDAPELIVVPEAPAVEAERDGRTELALYISAGVAYVTIGVFVSEILRVWFVGFGFLLICVWVIPALAKRARR